MIRTYDVANHYKNHPCPDCNSELIPFSDEQGISYECSVEKKEYR